MRVRNVIVAILVWCFAGTVPGHAEPNHFYIELETSTFLEMAPVIGQLEAQGLVTRHILPPDRIIAKGPESLITKIKRHPQVRALLCGKKGVGVDYHSPVSASAQMFTQLLKPLPQIPETPLSWGDIEGKPKMQAIPGLRKPAGGQGITTVSDSRYTAEYMVGRVAVGVILMESNATGGDAEDWTPEAENLVVSEFIQGMDWLCDSAESYDVKLSWVYEFHFGVPTGYEPIQEVSVPYYSPFWPPLSWEFLWIDDALNYLGIAEDEWDGCYALANHLRTTYHANWGYEVFVVNADKDSDKFFEDGIGAYMMEYCRFDADAGIPPCEFSPSPIVVIPYRGDLLNYIMDRTFGHETAHVFGASDEYHAPPWPTDCDEADDCSELHGYLHVRNGNCEYCNPNSVDCLMKYTDYPLCEFTKHQIGWRHSYDEDRVPDAIDPNYPFFLTIWPVQPGDLVKIFTMDGDFLEVIAVTEDNMATNPGGTGYILWDLINHSGGQVSATPDPFLVVINDNEAEKFGWQQADPAVLPTIVDFTFADGFLGWRLEDSFAYIRCYLYDQDDNLVTRSVWDKFYDVNQDYLVPVEGFEYGDSVTVRIFAWRPDGALSPTTELDFVMVYAPHVVSTSPAQNELNVAPSGSISVTFNADMDETTINNSTFVVHGKFTGLHLGSFSYDPESKTSTFVPDNEFDVGEVVSVSLTTGIQSAAAIPLTRSYAWSFTTETQGGSGTFADQSVYPMGGHDAEAIVAADFDGDGDNDLAAGGWYNGVSVLLNNGDGSFAECTTYTVGAQVYSISAADLDNDGDIDIATANAHLCKVSILLNYGNGIFAPHMEYAMGDASDHAWSVFAADLDCDGDIDLATANWDDYCISVILNNGEGNFSPYTHFSVPYPYKPWSISAADLNNDGIIDLCTASREGSAVCILAGTGDGNFSHVTDYVLAPGGYIPWSVLAADVNQDGHVDLESANDAGIPTTVLLNNGTEDFSFGTPIGYGEGYAGRDIGACDFNADGSLDLAISGAPYDSMSVFFNNGDGTFYLDSIYAAGDNPHSVAAADFDGDGDLDLAVGNQSSEDISVLLNLPPCNCGDPWGDLNCDGNINPVDVVYINNYVYLSNDLRCYPPGWYCPYDLGDVNCDWSVGPVDVVYYVNKVYLGNDMFCPDPCSE